MMNLFRSKDNKNFPHSRKTLSGRIIITDYEYKVAEITPISPRDVKIPARSFNLFPPGTEIAVFSRRSPVGILRIGDENSNENSIS